MPVLNVTSFWLFALATSIFSAMNERELRQRRADLQALVDVGARLDDVADPVLQARIVLDGLAARFGFERGLVIGAAEGNLIVLASRGAAEWSGTVPADAIVRKAWERRELLPVKRLDPEAQPAAERRRCRTRGTCSSRRCSPTADRSARSSSSIGPGRSSGSSGGSPRSSASSPRSPR